MCERLVLLSIRYAVPAAYKSGYQHKNRLRARYGLANQRSCSTKEFTKVSAEKGRENRASSLAP
jgi:hypothetical protein